MDKLYPGASPIGVISELVTALLNTNVHVFKVSPVIAITEVEMMNRLSKLFGFSDGDGITCPGGSFSNMLAMITARNILHPDIKSQGYRNYKHQLCVFTSDQAHYSITKACIVLGLGIESIIKVQSNENGQMTGRNLRIAIENAIEQGKVPFFVNGTAGTTVRGSYDEFKDIGAICEEFKCWFHIDACWGGAAIFSKKYSKLMNGCGTANSIAWNAHKLIGVPIQTSILLMKDKTSLIKSNSLKDITYLFHDEAQYDLGQKTIMCGRRADILKLFITWQYYGSSTFESWVNHAFDNAKLLTELIEDNSQFQLVFNTNSVNVCFRYLPSNITDKTVISSVNKKIHDILCNEGELFIDTNSSNELGTYFRVVFHSPLTTESHVRSIPSMILDAAAKLK